LLAGDDDPSLRPWKASELRLAQRLDRAILLRMLDTIWIPGIGASGSLSFVGSCPSTESTKLRKPLDVPNASRILRVFAVQRRILRSLNDQRVPYSTKIAHGSGHSRPRDRPRWMWWSDELSRV